MGLKFNETKPFVDEIRCLEQEGTRWYSALVSHEAVNCLFLFLCLRLLEFISRRRWLFWIVASLVLNSMLVFEFVDGKSEFFLFIFCTLDFFDLSVFKLKLRRLFLCDLYTNLFLK